MARLAVADVPLSRSLNIVGGARVESTQISVTNFPEEDATWLPPGSSGPADLEPGDADVDFSQRDVLPSLGLVYEPADEVTLRASYSQTIARQTFKELTPISQSEFHGGPVFIGNPDLGMSSLDNYDLRVDFESLELDTETLRELNSTELEAVAGGAGPVSENAGCRPFTDGCGILSVTCWTSGGPACA